MSGRLMSEKSSFEQENVSIMPAHTRGSSISQEMKRAWSSVRKEFPDANRVSFEFDGELVLHVDVRMGQTVPLIEARLASLNGGMFTNIRHGKTPGHRFLHRVSALVSG